MLRLFKIITRCLLLTISLSPLYVTSAAAYQAGSKLEPSPPPATQIHLTDQEINFLQSHPNITLGTSSDWEPYVIRRPDGGLEGFDVDILNYINEVTGAKIRLVTGKWSDIVAQAEERQIDGLATSAENSARAEHFIFSNSYTRVYPAFVVASNDTRTVNSIHDFDGQTVAFLAGNKFYQTLFSDYSKINIIETPTEAEAIKLVLEGKASAAVVATTSYHQHYMNFSQLIRIGYVATDLPLNILYSIRKDWPELVSIIDKSLAALSAEKYNESYLRWFGMEPTDEKGRGDELTFTEAEKAWLSQGHVVHARVGAAPPLHFDENGLKGMSLDYLNLVAQRAGFRVEYIAGIPWSKTLEDIQDKKNIDLILTAQVTPERKTFLDFTKTYIQAPTIIFNRTDSSFVGDIEDLFGKTVAVEDSFLIHAQLADR